MPTEADRFLQKDMIQMRDRLLTQHKGNIDITTERWSDAITLLIGSCLPPFVINDLILLHIDGLPRM